jgi:hypothetical protein
MGYSDTPSKCRCDRCGGQLHPNRYYFTLYEFGAYCSKRCQSAQRVRMLTVEYPDLTGAELSCFEELDYLTVAQVDQYLEEIEIDQKETS